MFATMRQGPPRHQDTSAGARRVARQARPTLEGLERRLSLSAVGGPPPPQIVGGIIIVTGGIAAAAPATAGGTPTQIVIIENMSGC
jgi:hypothetical protein